MRSETVAMSTPSASKRLAWLWRMVWSDAPLGRPRRRQRRDTVAEVKGDVTALETTVSTFGDLVNNKEILNLPLVTVDSRQAGSRSVKRISPAWFAPVGN
jgi:hypothetical protein